ncbi:5-hydroxytryptamine receptor 4-like [Aplysia californica]|uniref:5-hydroxytryptamine receptor 4-like n=1 Tax=Aplysia californica TaxID=6500 RepID=A0ABM0JJZ7_APLCA|nr:5-hydroxytryptamine receptor 4-like [Aplysia californica]
MSTTVPEATTESSVSSESLKVTLVDIGLCTFSALLSIFIIGSNVITILAICKTASLRSITNAYVASLAVTDIIVGFDLILAALFMLPNLRAELFYKSIHACVLMQVIGVAMPVLSAIHMTFIAVERYMYICKPYLYPRVVTNRFVSCTLSIAWTFGLFYAILLQFTHVPYGEIPLCDITKTLRIECLFYPLSAMYFPVVSIIVVMYILILRVALRQTKAICSTVPSVAGAISQQGNTGIGDQHKNSKNNASRRATLKSVKFFLTVFGVFFVCATPTVVVVGLDFYTTVPPSLYRLFNVITFMNSGMNFIIYAVQNQQFRAAFLRLAPWNRSRY